jgi:hypothetical protein
LSGIPDTDRCGTQSPHEASIRFVPFEAKKAVLWSLRSSPTPDRPRVSEGPIPFSNLSAARLALAPSEVPARGLDAGADRLSVR